MMSTRHARTAAAGAWLLTALLAAAPPAGAQEPDASAVLDSTRATLAKWVETRELISREREDWTLGKQVLEERLRLLEAELAELRGGLAETRGAIGAANEAREELRGKRDGLEEASSTLDEIVASLEAKTRRLVAQLPAPLTARIAPLARRIPEDPAKAEPSLGQRFQNVIGLVNEVNKFNGDVTLVSEVRELPGGGAAEVRTLYLGLAQAWYVTPNGDAAGVGRPGPEGWEWSADDELAPRVAQVIGVLEGDQVPAYVALPVVMP